MKPFYALQSFLVFGILAALLGACAHAPTKIAAPPSTTQDSCRQIRDFFKTVHVTSEAPDDMSAGCHLHLSASDRDSRLLDRRLEAEGWKRDPAYGKGAAPRVAVYETPSTHCTIEKLFDLNSANHSVISGVGIDGGSHLSTDFGVGIRLGPNNDPRLDYKIDCLPKVVRAGS